MNIVSVRVNEFIEKHGLPESAKSELSLLMSEYVLAVCKVAMTAPRKVVRANVPKQQKDENAEPVETCAGTTKAGKPCGTFRGLRVANDGDEKGKKFCSKHYAIAVGEEVVVSTEKKKAPKKVKVAKPKSDSIVNSPSDDEEKIKKNKELDDIAAQLVKEMEMEDICDEECDAVDDESVTAIEESSSPAPPTPVVLKRKLPATIAVTEKVVVEKKKKAVPSLNTPSNANYTDIATQLLRDLDKTASPLAPTPKQIVRKGGKKN